MEQQPGVSVDQAHRVLTIICLALVGGVVTMAGVSVILVTSGTFPPFLGYPEAVRLGVGAFLLLLLGASYPVYRHAGGATNPDEPGGALSAFQTKVIAAMALREFVGIAGGLLILLSRDMVLGGTLVVLSVATMLLALPRKEDLREALQESTRRS
jgi:hypothetical protein